MGHLSGNLAAAVLLSAATTGCLRTKPSLHDPDPANRIPAIRQAAERNDRAAAPLLVAALDDDDPAVRFYAIRALRTFSGGQTYGYDYYADDDARKPAVARWRQWLAAGGGK